MHDLQSSFDSREIDKKWQEYWQNNRIFEFDWKDVERDNIYSIDTPPPHVSGVLHMGHVFGYSQMDIVARFQRMHGKNVYFPVGYDDNGLPSERYVEKKINRKSKNMERREFIHICEKETKDAEQLIRNLFIRASYSFDFREEYRTISKMSSRISQLSFIDLHRKNLLQREEKPIIWDVVDQTALAQSELEEKDIESQMNYLSFSTNDAREIVIMTTRPELLPACVAVMCHPDSYDSYRGSRIITPLGVEVEIIADDKVDKTKGTGFVMCCTFGDQTDVEWWKKYNLPLRAIINDGGFLDLSRVENLINQEYMSLSGLNIKGARSHILELLAKNGKIARTPEKVVHTVKIGERSKSPIEFLVKKQWFIKILDSKNRLYEQIDRINWKPEWMKTRLYSWVDGLNMDWCISRQRFFGIPIPVWYSLRKGEENRILLPEIDQLPVDPLEDLPPGYSRDEVVAESDILDTWATSAISPQLSIHGINEHLNDDAERYRILKIPFDLRAQGHDIIRTWAFYSILKSDYHSGSIPWNNILVNGWCLASDGTKMSKSLGNAIEPLKIFDQFGSDAIRYWTAKSSPGMDTSYQESIVKNGKKLLVKLLNVAKFIEIHLGNLTENIVNPEDDIKNSKIFETMDLWLLDKINHLMDEYNKAFSAYEYSKALELLEVFFWNYFCDNYLEIVKIRCYGLKSTRHEGKNPGQEEQQKIEKSQQSAIRTLYYSYNSLLKLFAPFIPVICDEIYSYIFREEFNLMKSIHVRGNCAKMFTAEFEDNIRNVGQIVLRIVADVRKYKSEKNISLKEKLEKLNICSPQDLTSVVDEIENVCGVKKLTVARGAGYSIDFE
ncbi:MAG: valine--tRNA ligase [Rickettsiales bacterium]|jgi:valyl-tRNA synthetase|nr:valine--tRNA ligase [Rickettsiales bacterium]